MKTVLPFQVLTMASALALGLVHVRAAEDSPQGSLTERLGYSYSSIGSTTLAPVQTSILPITEQPEVLMPRIVVTTRRLDLGEQDVLTPRGRMKEAQKKYLSPVYQKTFGPLAQIAGYYFNFLTILNGWHPNESEAYLFAQQDEIVRIRRELGRLEKLDAFGRGYAQVEPVSAR